MCAGRFRQWWYPVGRLQDFCWKLFFIRPNFCWFWLNIRPNFCCVKRELYYLGFPACTPGSKTLGSSARSSASRWRTTLTKVGWRSFRSTQLKATFAPKAYRFLSKGSKVSYFILLGTLLMIVLLYWICVALSSGIPPQVVMKFTGHADYKSMKPYIDIAEKSKTDAMAAMEKALNG